MIRTTYNEAGANEPVRIEQVFAEKPAGGIVKEPGFDAPATTAVSADGDKFKVMKAYRLVAPVAAEDTTIKIAKGSGVAVGDAIGHGKKSVACTAVSEGVEYDTVTVTLGVAIATGTVLYEAASASASSATPKGTAVYVTGNALKAGHGDQPVRLINGANLRKETANIAPEVVAQLKNINLV